MSTDDGGLSSIRCPECRRKLKVPAKLSGKRVPCPACQATIDIPALQSTAEASPKVAVPVPPSTIDDSEFRLEEVTPSSKKTASALGDQFGFDLEELVAQPVAPKKPESNEEFRFACKVCGTALYARREEVGKTKQCPDCHVDVVVPAPAKAKPKGVEPDLRKIEDVPLSPVAANSQKSREGGRSLADDYLARAAAEAEKEDAKSRDEVYDFDTAGWFKRSFALFGDPSVLIIAVTTGALMGGVKAASIMAKEMIGGFSPTSAGLGEIVVLALLGTPLFIGTLVNGLAILETSANRLKRVQRWPMFALNDAMGELIVVVAAFALSALPGGILGWLAPRIGMPAELSVAIVFLGTCLAFPVVLLGMLDNQSVGEPFSRPVIDSLSSRKDAWGAMYMMSGLGMATLFVLYWMTIGKGMTIQFIFGLSLPFLIYFIFHQYGVLATRIADVTNLAFESAEEEETPEEEAATS